MKRCRPLGEVMSIRPVQFPILNRLTSLDHDLRAQCLSVTRCSNQRDCKPMITIPLIVEEKLRTTDKIGSILTVGHEEIKEAIAIVVCPGSPAATTHYQVIHTDAGSDIGESPVPIVSVKVICSLSHGITSRVHYVKVQ